MVNFYLSTITPLFFVECLADLEKAIRSRSTPELLVGSLADRTPESQSYPNVHHTTLLNAELSRQFDLYGHHAAASFWPEVSPFSWARRRALSLSKARKRKPCPGGPRKSF